MKSKKIFVLVGNPDRDSLCGALAEMYIKGARAQGHTVESLYIGDMQFDPILRHGYRVIQQLEPDLILLQTRIREADHIVIVYPNWWGSMPAVLKGLFDRVWIPRFAFRYYKEGWMGRLHMWEKLLSGKTARLIVTTNSPPWLLWLAMGDVTYTLKQNILRFSGISVCTTMYGPSEQSSPETYKKWLNQAYYLGFDGK
jgi:putative NADPH-quinone reductase